MATDKKTGDGPVINNWLEIFQNKYGGESFVYYCCGHYYTLYKKYVDNTARV